MEVQMEEVRDVDLREQILQRREKLQTALSKSERNESLMNLLHEVDVALEKMHKGTYGLCEACHESIEKERLTVDPLIRNCLDHLTPTEQRVLEQDLDLAYEIQNVLLPKQDFTVGGWSTSYIYKPAGPVSGDYLDLIIPEEGDGSLVFLLGDVSGKGVAASMLMANLHAIFRSLVKVNIPIDKLVEKANRLFCEATMLTHFATLVCGLAKPSGEIEICNAGHCFPLLMKEDGIERIESTGFPLGMFCGGQFSTKKVKLAQGDSLFLYSDGLSEARNGSNILYGDKRLTTLIGKKKEATPRGLVEACIKDLKSFQSGFPMSDDLTMMAIQRVGQ
jgi:sigma-B regulation protein RsbU (phosphoserine phosphatase)